MIVIVDNDSQLNRLRKTARCIEAPLVRFPPLAAARRFQSWAVEPLSALRAGIDVMVRPDADLGLKAYGPT